MIFVLLAMVLWAVSSALLWLGVREANRLSDRETQDHAKCMSMIAAFVGDEFAAQVLLSAADALDGMDGQAELARVARTLWVDGGPNVPVLWLRERADMLHSTGYFDDPDEEPDDE